jgi:endonuclease YncB( thermonuclease family)
MNRKLTTKNLIKKRVPYILIPGLLLAGILGFNSEALSKVKNYYDLKILFPYSGTVKSIEDGDTLRLRTGQTVRLIGIDAPQGEYTDAQKYLVEKTMNKKIFIEYDRYQDDKFGRILGWVWVECESAPQFLPANYMHKSQNESNEGLRENPLGCKNGKLLQKELVNKGFAEPVVYAKRGKLKYEEFITDNDN